MSSISGKVAIVGIGITDFSSDSGKTELMMACETIKSALDDAGLTPLDIDGIVKHSDDATDEHSIINSMGMGNISFFGECRWEAAPCAMTIRAAIGVAAGMCNYVVVYRSVNGSSGRRMRPSMRDDQQLTTGQFLQRAFHAPFGHSTEAGHVAMMARRYMFEYGVDEDEFGWVVTTCREHGARNPNSRYFDRPLTMQEYRDSKMLVEPLRVLDCYEKADAAAAFIVTTAERAKHLKQKPAYVLGAAQSQVMETEEKMGFYRDSLSELPEMVMVGKRLFAMANVKPEDIHVAQLDDSYSPFVPMQLEALGFCKSGEGVDFCEGGHRIRLGGRLPINTSGGSLGEGHIHGMNHVIEAVKQIRGTSVAQMKEVGLALVVSGAGGPAAGLILGDG